MIHGVPYMVQYTKYIVHVKEKHDQQVPSSFRMVLITVLYGGPLHPPPQAHHNVNVMYTILGAPAY